jgi:SRSO17 transposase
MTGEELLKIVDELDAYYREFDGCFSRSEGRGMIRLFARGQLGAVERKSLEPIADGEGVEPQALQLFFARNEWDEEARWISIRSAWRLSWAAMMASL